jgi:hypothetical protein
MNFNTKAKTDKNRSDIKLKYFYCTLPVGILTKTRKGFSYSSNIEAEQDLLRKKLLSYTEYGLWDSKNREADDLFTDFNLLVAELRKDIITRANIFPQDSNWEKLVKLSDLDFFPSGFYVQRVCDNTK